MSYEGYVLGPERPKKEIVKDGDGFPMVWRFCQHCRGTGLEPLLLGGDGMDASEACSCCHGSGKVPEQMTLEEKVNYLGQKLLKERI